MKEFTPRQKEIIHLVCAEGMVHKQVGARLSISASTVKNHVGPLLRAVDEMSMNRVCFRYGRGEFGLFSVRSIYKEKRWTRKPDRSVDV